MTRAFLTTIVLIGALGLALATGAAAGPAAACTRVAATNGSDSAPGTEGQPFRSVQRLAGSLAPGQTGCLRAGTHAGNVTVATGGAAGAPITITSYPGERAAIAGKLWVTDSANHVTFAALDLDGRNPSGLPSPAVNGDDVSFVDNDVTNNHSATCFILGPTTYGRAHRTLIERNRIHGCGELPATNFDHGIYIEHATGARVLSNLIQGNSDRGVQLYPDAQHTHVARNVIDGNGEGVLIAGGAEESGPQASSDNLIELNLITNSTQRHNVESHWGSPLVGERNVVRNNCIWGGARDGDNHGLAPARGFTAVNNLPCRDLASVGASRGRAVVLRRPRSALRPGRRVRVTGRVSAARAPRRVVLRARSGRRWRRVGSARIRRDGRFRAVLRLRVRRARARSAGRPFALRRVKLSRHARRIKVRASARGVGRSNVVRIRVRPRRS